MRKLFLFTAVITLSSCSLTAQNRQACRFDSIAKVLIKDSKYQQALTILGRELNALESGNPDSLYIDALVKSGFCYYHLNNPMKSIESYKRAIDFREASHDSNDLYMSMLYDDLSTSYEKLGDYELAYQWCQKAVDITRRNQSDVSLTMTHLSHASSLANACSDKDKAISLQKDAVAIARSYYGWYSDQHLDQLSNLRKYYAAAGDTIHREQVVQIDRQIRQDRINGVLPEKTDLSTVSACRLHNLDALLCSRWVLNNYLNTDGMRRASSYLLQFRKNSPDVVVYVGSAEEKWLSKLNALYYLPYMAASIEYALTHPESARHCYAQYQYAIERLLDYYDANRSLTGENKVLNSYLSLRNKGKSFLRTRLKSDYEAYLAQVFNGNVGQIEVDDLILLQFQY